MRPFPPLGLQYLVAYLRQRGRSVEWWDSTFAGDDLTAPLAENPRVVGFYGHTITRPHTRELVRRCVAEGRRVIAGGPDPVQYLEDYLAMGVEVVVIGEGERTVADLLDHLAANQWVWDVERLRDIDGIAFLEPAGSVVRTRPRALIRKLDELPWPHRDRAGLAGYLSAWKARHGETALSLTTSRGCPYHCTWCSKQVYGDTFRRRDVDEVLNEVEYLRDTWSPDQLWFVDDMFTINRKWVERFCARKVTRDIVMPFYLIGRAETLDPALLEQLARAGCSRIFLSAESGADHVLDAMKKGTSVAEIDRAGEQLRAAGIELGVFVMLGYPGEEKRDILATRDMLRRLDPAVTLLSVAHPMKGTAFYDSVSERITGESGGRLLFHMRYSARVYGVAQKMIWADCELRSALAARDPIRALRASVRYPLWRAAFAALS